MSESNNHPKVFISYSRTNSEHTNNVVEFAARLISDGIDVKIDEFDLNVGNDINYFMENNIKNESDKILLILDKEFVKKANNRESGVGTETQLLSKEVYDDVEQERIIPIVWECNEKGEPYLPNFIESRLCIDLSTEENFAENYEILLRILYNKPLYKKEELGEMPKWLQDDNEYYPKTNELVKIFKYNVNRHPEKINPIIEEFYDAYYEYLKTFTIKFTSNDDKTVVTEIYDNIEKYNQLKNNFEDFTHTLTKIAKHHNVDYDIIIEFLINVHSLTVRSRDGQSHYVYDFYNFDFILREIFLYFIAYGLKNKDYELISILLNSPYYLTDDYNKQKGTQHFVEFDKRESHGVETYLKYYYEVIEKKPRISATGELLIRRLSNKINSEDLVNADLLCCYVSFLNFDEYNDFWFPYTYIYKEDDSSFEVFRRLTSRKYFEKVKKIFDVETIEEFKNKVISTQNSLLGRRQIRFNNVWGKHVQPIEDYIALNQIGREI